MILIFGGAYQGKLDFAKEKYGVKPEEILDCELLGSESGTADFLRDLAGVKVIYNFHRAILQMIDEGITPSEFVKSHIEELADKIVICDDISCGVVPVDRKLRLWREETGRVLVLLAGISEKRIRMFCGIGNEI